RHTRFSRDWSSDVCSSDLVTNLKTGQVTGKQLRDFWEQEIENVFATDATRRFGGWLPRPSGMTLRFAASAAPGHRVQEIRVGGRSEERRVGREGRWRWARG